MIKNDLKKFNSPMIKNDDKKQNSTHQEDIKIPNVYAPNKTSSKYRWIKPKGERYIHNYS